MKKILVILQILVLIFSFNSCEIEVPPKYFDVNGSEYDLNVAFMDDWGPEGDLSFRWWAISFRSEELMPSNYITFLLGSYENTGDFLTEGSYEYDYLGGEGFFSDISVGYNIGYDSKGYPVGNLLNSEYADFTGFIDINRDGTKYFFNFDLQVEYQGEIINILGEYEGRLTMDAGVVDIYSY